MNITKLELHETLIAARVSLSKDISEFNKIRNGGTYFRTCLREKIAAYRILSNLATIEATTYTHSQRDLARLKKALAK